MKPIKPITIIDPALRLIIDGKLGMLWRAGATMTAVRVGDRLWVREPFYLPRGVNHLSPSGANQLGHKPTFRADLDPASPKPADWLGQPRMARTLLREWHRFHLKVTGIERRRLQTITEPEARAQGFACIAHFQKAWNANLMFGNRQWHWDKNPVVPAIAFDRIEGKVQ